MRVLKCVAVAAALFVASAAPAGAAYPEAPVTIVVGANPGASGDLMARLLAQKLSDRWKQPVVVENKSGASGILAANEVRNAKPDGYTIYVSNDSAAINEVVQKNKPFEHIKVFAPVSLLALIDFKLVVHPSLPVKTVPDLIAYAKANPGKLNYASSGEYSPHHLMAEMFRDSAGIDAVHVPFRGTAAAITAVIAHHADYAFSGFSGVDAQIQSGQLRALATTGKKRNQASPDLPTIGETLPGFSAGSWWAMWVRNEVPPPVRDEITKQVRAIIAEPEVQRALLKTGLDPVGSTPAELRSFLDEEIAKLRKLPASVIKD
jgi:tripartite-type tricarboxylate transporter receptor subunit TctC